MPAYAVLMPSWMTPLTTALPVVVAVRGTHISVVAGSANPRGVPENVGNVGAELAPLLRKDPTWAGPEKSAVIRLSWASVVVEGLLPRVVSHQFPEASTGRV